MKAHVLTGTKDQIAASIAKIDGVIREAIVLVEEPLPTPAIATPGEDIFAEMEPYMADAGDANYSREWIYEPQEGE
jgi:hypothetical protein